MRAKRGRLFTYMEDETNLKTGDEQRNESINQSINQSNGSINQSNESINQSIK